MFRPKMLIVLAGMIVALAVSAMPASAWWRGNANAENQETEGKVNVLKEGEFVDEGSKVKCPAKGIEAKWTIQTKGQIKQHGQSGKQERTKEGPHLNIKILKWGTECTAEILGLGLSTAEVKPCVLQLVQQKEALTATGGVVTGCLVKSSVCEIQVPAGMEKQPGSNEGVNVGLTEIKLANSESKNQKDVVNVKGIHANTNGGLCPIPNQTTAEFKNVEIEVVGATAV